ncbi:hypothetical protein TNCT_398191 [Trichonephila clavata]|uniref:Uncharacterized protein n=1 Tax=Trichonephila clavata TaxID=2740835 RepID=A0A8X6GT63_TRICU|nr:hypothetical protein TNCT_398191 [Trichonephila clavata]
MMNHSVILRNLEQGSGSVEQYSALADTLDAVCCKEELEQGLYCCNCFSLYIHHKRMRQKFHVGLWRLAKFLFPTNNDSAYYSIVVTSESSGIST